MKKRISYRQKEMCEAYLKAMDAVGFIFSPSKDRVEASFVNFRKLSEKIWALNYQILEDHFLDQYQGDLRHGG